MTGRTFLIALATLAAFFVLMWLLLTGEVPEIAPTGEGPVEAIATPTPAPPQRIVLLFAGSDGRLQPELREVPLPAEVHERARVVVNELLAGPTGELTAVVPYEAQVEGVYIGGQGVVFIDLTPPPEPLQGSHIELMLVYGVVNSVLLNCPELTAVQLLFGGTGIPTLTGHLDLSRPLVLNKRLIATS
jgi:hypothetical protein